MEILRPVDDKVIAVIKKAMDGRSQTEFASAMGISQGNLNSVLRGRAKNITVDFAKRVLDAAEDGTIEKADLFDICKNSKSDYCFSDENTVCSVDKFLDEIGLEKNSIYILKNVDNKGCVYTSGNISYITLKGVLVMSMIMSDSQRTKAVKMIQNRMKDLYSVEEPSEKEPETMPVDLQLEIAKEINSLRKKCDEISSKLEITSGDYISDKSEQDAWVESRRKTIEDFSLANNIDSLTIRQDIYKRMLEKGYGISVVCVLSKTKDKDRLGKNIPLVRRCAKSWKLRAIYEDSMNELLKEYRC